MTDMRLKNYKPKFGKRRLRESIKKFNHAIEFENVSGLFLIDLAKGIPGESEFVKVFTAMKESEDVKTFKINVPISTLSYLNDQDEITKNIQREVYKLCEEFDNRIPEAIAKACGVKLKDVIRED